MEIINGPQGCAQLENVATFSEASQGDDPDYDYPYGLVSFEIPCAWARVRVYFHGATAPISAPYRKFGPVPPYTDGPIWYSLDNTSELVFGSAQIGLNNPSTVYYAEFTLTDGGLGDDTGTDGTIYDQGGPGLPPAGIPTLNEWGMIIFTLLIALSGIYYRRRENC